MKDILKSVFTATLILLTTILVGWVFVGVYGENVKVECRNLQQQSTEYKDFFLTKYEKAMCEDYGFQIEAPVR